MSTADNPKTMHRTLKLRHVFALSTGAMVSSGLFLLPGLAAAEGGPSAILAYAIAGILVIPSMLSVAELSTAMPRAGGAYYFLERALGPAVGTITGMGTWLSLVLKDSFALIGMSAYLNLVVDVPTKPLALVLIVIFTAVNIAGSKASASIQIMLVAFVLGVMAIFLVAGGINFGDGEGSLEPFFTDGAGGIVAVIGLVFVSYGGLTKVASVAEEIEDPSRNIPLGMALSLLASTVLYTLAVLVAVAVVPAERLHDDLAPIHSAAKAVLPAAGAVLVAIAALAAFSSAVNAGILAAGRYPLAMSREGLLPPVFLKLTKSRTPIWGIVVTGAAMALVVTALDVHAIAKLASAFVLLTFALVNLAVLVLRASHIRSYAPGFHSPMYPFMQFVGIGIAVYLIVNLGALSLLMVSGAIAVSLAWYFAYGRKRSTRAGAIYHVFERWGASADRTLDRELRAAAQSHGLRVDDEYPGLIARAAVINLPDGIKFSDAAGRAAQVLATRMDVAADVVSTAFQETGSLWIRPSEKHATATPIAFFDTTDEHLIIARSPGGIQVPPEWGGRGETVNALFFLAGRSEEASKALRLAGELAAHQTADDGEALATAGFESEIKAVLLPELAIEQYPLLPELPTGQLIGHQIGELNHPPGVHFEAVVRHGKVLNPDDDFILEADDQLTLIGPVDGLPPIERFAEMVTESALSDKIHRSQHRH